MFAGRHGSYSFIANFTFIAVILLVSFAMAEVSILLCSAAIAEGFILGRVAIIEAFSIILGTYVVAELIFDIVNSFAIISYYANNVVIILVSVIFETFSIILGSIAMAEDIIISFAIIKVSITTTSSNPLPPSIFSRSSLLALSGLVSGKRQQFSGIFGASTMRGSTRPLWASTLGSATSWTSSCPSPSTAGSTRTAGSPSTWSGPIGGQASAKAIVIIRTLKQL